MSAFLLALLLQCVAVLLLFMYLLTAKKGCEPKAQILNSNKSLEEEEKHLVLENRQYTDQAEQSFEQELSDFRNAVAQNFEKELRNALADFNLFLQNLENEGKTAQKGLEEKILSQTSQILEKNQGKAETLIKGEVMKAKEVIEAYKHSKLKAVDEHIVAILEETLNGFIKKKLTPQDNVDLVYQSLKEAKEDNFISL